MPTNMNPAFTRRQSGYYASRQSLRFTQRESIGDMMVRLATGRKNPRRFVATEDDDGKQGHRRIKPMTFGNLMARAMLARQAMLQMLRQKKSEKATSEDSGHSGGL